jgi:hypothetical protein
MRSERRSELDYREERRSVLTKSIIMRVLE